MGNICKSQIQQIEPDEVNLQTQHQIDEQRNVYNQKQNVGIYQKQESVTEDQKALQDQNVEQQRRTENNQELKRRENKKMAQIAAIIDQEVIYENIHKQEKVKSPFDFQLLLNGFSNSFIFAQLQGENKYSKQITFWYSQRIQKKNNIRLEYKFQYK